MPQRYDRFGVVIPVQSEKLDPDPGPAKALSPSMQAVLNKLEILRENEAIELAKAWPTVSVFERKRRLRGLAQTAEFEALVARASSGVRITCFRAKTLPFIV